MYLITGNMGFIGSHLQKFFEDRGEQTWGLDPIDPNHYLITVNQLIDEIQRLPWKRIKRVFHLGASTNTQLFDPHHFYQYNVRFTQKLLMYADYMGVPVTYASSAAVYGNSMPNSSQVNPLNQYAMSKLAIDHFVRDYDWKVNIVGMRFFNVYGMNERKGDMSSLINKMITSKEPKLFRGSSAYYRDFICVEDVVEILSRTYVSGIYDIGTGHPANLKEVADKISYYTGKDYDIVPMPDVLKKQYQEYTRAKFFPEELSGFTYKSVNSWLLNNLESMRVQRTQSSKLKLPP